MKNNNIKIFILAGGFGTRLKALVSDVPKPMAPIFDKPFLTYQIKEIRKYFPNNKIYLLTHYLSESIEVYFKHDILIQILKEEKPLGTGGSIKHAISQLNLSENEAILVFNGDTYSKPDLNMMIQSCENNISILGSYQIDCNRYGVLKNKKNKIINFSEKKIGIKNSYINAGCYYFKNLSFFNNIQNNAFAIEDKFKDYLLSSSIDIFRYNDIFIDIGIPQDYKKMINYIQENENE